LLFVGDGLVRDAGGEEGQDAERRARGVALLADAGAIAGKRFGLGAVLVLRVSSETFQGPTTVRRLVHGKPFETLRDRGLGERIAATFHHHALARRAAAPGKGAAKGKSVHAARCAKRTGIACVQRFNAGARAVAETRWGRKCLDRAFRSIG